MATARLLGRTTASTGAPEEISVGTGLSLSGGSLSASGGGAWVFLSSVTASNSATVDIETTFDSTYDNYVIVANNIILATDNTTMLCRLKIGGSYIDSSTYTYHVSGQTSATTNYSGSVAAVAAPTTQIRICAFAGNDSGETTSFNMHISSPSSTSVSKDVMFYGKSINASGEVILITGAGRNSGTAALTGVRIYAGSGNITSGTFRLYGIKNS
jgi:hypothetical protein